MKLHELQKQIVYNQLDRLYIFYGDEIGIMDVYLDKMYSIVDADVIKTETVQEAYSRTVQRRLSNKPRCFVVRDDKEFFKNDKVWNKVFTHINNSTDYLILIYSSMDKRSKFFKSHSTILTEFEKLSSDLLSSYVREELKGIDNKTAKYLAEICECNYNRIMLECHKIKSYVSGMGKEANIKYADAVNELVEKGIIFKPIGDITFKFTDAILTRNFEDTSRYLAEAKLKGEPEIMVLSILYNGFKQILMVQGLGKDQSEPVKRTGLTAWQVKMAKEKQGHYSINELIEALKIIRFVEKSIKTGQIEAEIALEYAIVNIM